MSKTTFENLITKIVHEQGTDDCIKNHYIPISTQVLITLWILATPDSFRSVGNRFKINKGTVHYVYVQNIKKISALAKDYIKWPDENEIAQIKHEIERSSGFPGVVGFIDGKYINIKAPSQSVRYYNRKKQTALHLQGVCDNKLRFTDIYFGEVGSLHDNRVYTRSPLASAIRNDPQKLFGANGHLLGDSAYMLSKTMMTPYRDNGHLLDEQKHYNYVHASNRNRIERAFALLAGKWRRLKYLDSNVFEYITNHVMGCCVSHNFVINENDDYSMSHETSFTGIPQTQVENNEENVILNTEASKKRDNIAVLLYEKMYCN